MEHFVFNSKTAEKALTLTAPYYNAIRPTTVEFEEEGCSVFVNSEGHIEVYDKENNSLGFVDVPCAESPDMYAHSGQYGTIDCFADGKTITLTLPVYEWEDYYPHCDGESDRWNRKTIRHFRVVFDCESKEITILDR